MSERFFGLPRRPVLREAEVENFLSAWAARGYLVLGATPDTAAHGDPHFLTGRPRQLLLPAAADYWQRHTELHDALRRNELPHTPLALGSDVDASYALAWLVPAPAHGQLQAVAGFEEKVELSAGQRRGWLLALAKCLLALAPGARALVQPPAPEAACWYYGAYLGDLPVPGATHSEQIRLLLAGLPRYAGPTADQPGQPATPTEAAAWPLLINVGVRGFSEGVIRSGYRELVFGSLPSAAY